ncbi:hypothetical protein [Thermoleophilum album]|uniref:hypothetical protein n=1 Tax=Thermoleophilum album TaxID=29539 RepID=UPI001FE00AB6|nr:hypothetical protein [Thermoleophilum album]
MFVQVTDSPTRIVTLAGLKAKLWIVTPALAMRARAGWVAVDEESARRALDAAVPLAAAVAGASAADVAPGSGSGATLVAVVAEDAAAVGAGTAAAVVWASPKP